MDKQTLLDLLYSGRDLAAGLIPGALGASVSASLQAGLTWLQRFVQITIGVVVSYYAGEAAGYLFELSGPVKNGIGFVSGLAALELVKNVKEVAAQAPKDLWDNVKSWFGKKSA